MRFRKLRIAWSVGCGFARMCFPRRAVAGQFIPRLTLLVSHYATLLRSVSRCAVLRLRLIREHSHRKYSNDQNVQSSRLAISHHSNLGTGVVHSVGQCRGFEIPSWATTPSAAGSAYTAACRSKYDSPLAQLIRFGNP